MHELRILGPIELHSSHAAVPIHRKQPRLILGTLALHSGTPVPSELLIDRLWPDNPPATARAVVHSRISELRALLADATAGAIDVASHRTAYELVAPDGAVDAQVFTRLVAEAASATRSEERRTKLRQAIDLWRGPLLGTAFTTVEQLPAAIALTEARLQAYEDLFDTELRLDNPRGVGNEAIILVKAEPGRERLVELAMTALHRSGRSGEALAMYATCQRWLRDHLGTGPARRLQEIHLQILHSSDPAPAEQTQSSGFRPLVPRTLPPASETFVGRDAELTTILTWIAEREAPVVAVTGAAGVGKSALSVKAAHLLAERFPDGQLFVDLHGADDRTTASVADVIARFLAAVGIESAGAGHLERDLDAYRTFTATRKILILLDNIGPDHELASLVPAGTGSRLIINGRHRLASSLAMHALELDVLAEDDAVMLLDQLSGDRSDRTDPGALRELAARCGCLPLALRIAGAKLRAEPHRPVRQYLARLGDDTRRIGHLSLGKQSVRASINLTYSEVSDDARFLLCALSDMNLSELTRWSAAALLGCESDHAEDVLDELYACFLCHSSRIDSIGDTRFGVHDLVRAFAKAVAAEADAGGRQRLHDARRRLSGAYLSIAERSYLDASGDFAHHILGHAERYPVDATACAAIINHRLAWFDEELPQITETIRSAAQHGETGTCWELTSLLTPLFETGRRFDTWRATSELVLEACRVAGDRRGVAVALFRQAAAAAETSSYEDALRSAAEATSIFTGLADTRSVATVRLLAGTIHRVTGDHKAALASFSTARSEFDPSLDAGSIAFASRGIGQAQLAQGQLDDALRSLNLALSGYLEIDCRQGAAMTTFWRGMARLARGETGAARRDLSAALDIARQLNDKAGEAQSLRGLALVQAAEKDTDGARATLHTALALIDQPTPTPLITMIRAALDALDS